VDKSPVLAFVLSFLLGPLGLLYVAAVPALILLAVAVGANFAFGLSSPLARVVSGAAWITSIVWACVEASRKHRESERWRASTGNQGIPVSGYQQAAAPAYFPGQTAPLPPPGWYPDSSDTTLVRWWDGSKWTSEVRSV
jgi:putative Ca2+/H+ antiporter (TMEM165/GDT1 family)